MNKEIVKRQALERKHRRVRGRVSGNAERPRLNVYRSERHIYSQLIDDDQGKTLVSVSTIAKDMRSKLADSDPTDQARLVGEAIAEKALAAGIKQVVFDRGGRRYIGRVQALADGARSKGLQF